MHALQRGFEVMRLKQERDEQRRTMRKRLDREAAERQIERFGVDFGHPLFPEIRKAIVTAGMKGMDIDDPKVSRAIADKVLNAADKAERREETDVVYYIRVGELIKVGTTSDLPKRMMAYPPNAELLVTETGSYDRETQRIVEFTEYLAGRREWFHPGPRLMDHIDTLRRVGSAK